MAAVFSRTAARVVVPIVFVMHLVIFQVMGVFFPATPLLLLFVDWDALDRRLRARRPDRPPQPLEPSKRPAPAHSTRAVTSVFVAAVDRPERSVLRGLQLRAETGPGKARESCSPG